MSAELWRSTIEIPRSIGAPQRFSLSLPRLSLLALALHGWLLIESAALHLLENAFLHHMLLEGLERQIELIAGDFDSGRRDHARHGCPPRDAGSLTMRDSPPRSGCFGAVNHVQRHEMRAAVCDGRRDRTEYVGRLLDDFAGIVHDAPAPAALAWRGNGSNLHTL